MYIQTPYSHYRFQKRHPSLLMKKIIAHERLMEGEHLQGICPNGWHIPTQQEWSSLMRLLEYASEYCPGYRGCEEFKENNGFGWYSSRFLHVVGFGDFTVEPFVFIQQDDNGTWSTFVILMDNWKGYTYTANEVSGLLSVRCVKD